VSETGRVDVRAEVRFTVLQGTVGALADGHPIALGGPQQRRLLAALLANHDTVVSADRLVESVWSHDDAPEGARRTVMSYVSRLRSAIGEEHLVTREHGYELALDGASFDATDFELALAEARVDGAADAVAAYDRALGYWSGRAYGDDANEWWLLAVAGRLEELRLLALGERAAALIDSGRHADAVVEIQVLVADQPLREHFVGLLMRALYLGGRQAEALRTFQRFRQYLADETGLDPSDALVELDHRIAQGDPSLPPGPPWRCPATSWRRSSARAPSGPSTVPSNPVSAGRSRSKWSAPSLPMIPGSCSGSRPRPSSWPASSIPTSCRCTTSGADQGLPSWCSGSSGVAR